MEQFGIFFSIQSSHFTSKTWSFLVLYFYSFQSDNFLFLFLSICSFFGSLATRRYWTTPAKLFLVDTDLENIKYAELAKYSAEKFKHWLAFEHGTRRGKTHTKNHIIHCTIWIIINQKREVENKKEEDEKNNSGAWSEWKRSETREIILMLCVMINSSQLLNGETQSSKLVWRDRCVCACARSFACTISNMELNIDM